jgi:hypothetical protein
LRLAENVAWAAGLFEGEGSIICATKSHGVQLSLGSTDRDVIDRFVRMTGGKIYGPYRPNGKRTPANRKDIFQWKIQDTLRAQVLLREFWPYLGERRRAKAAEAIASHYEYKRLPQRRNHKAL